MSTLYSHQSSNVWKTWLLMTCFLVGIILFGFLISYVYGSPAILYGAVILSLIMNFTSYFFSDKIVLSMANAKQIEKKEDYPELWNSLENLSITAGLPMPKLYIIDDPAPNAFATGRNKDHAVVAVTTGLLPLLNKSELEGVLAHELSHIGNRDILLQTIVVMFVGLISIVSDMLIRMSIFGSNRENKHPIGIVFAILAAILAPLAATIVQLAISRKREFLADASGALLTRYPDALASALQKISSFPKELNNANHAMAHMYISDPFVHSLADGEEEKVSWFTKLFMTHPPVKERVAALLNKNQG